MSDLIGTIPYENIESVQVTCNGQPCNLAGAQYRLSPTVKVRYLVTPGNNKPGIGILRGTYVTLDTSNPALSGIYRVAQAGTDGPHETVTLDLSDKSPIVRKAWALYDQSGLSGQIFFGKRSGTGKTGGTVTQILNTDFGRAAGAAVLAFGAILLIRYLVKD